MTDFPGKRGDGKEGVKVGKNSQGHSDDYHM